MILNFPTALLFGSVDARRTLRIQVQQIRDGQSQLSLALLLAVSLSRNLALFVKEKNDYVTIEGVYA